MYSTYPDGNTSDTTTTALYEASPPLISSIWRLNFSEQRESSPHDLFVLLRFINEYVEIVVVTVLRTWDNEVPVYWVRFQDTMQALVARGFITNAEGRHSVKVAGALVSSELFKLAEEEERNPQFVPPLATNRWEYPLRTQNAPMYKTSTEQTNHHNVDAPTIATRQTLQERIKRATLLERISSD
ncbi:hypothetical protein AB1N83_012111 [Pleurotus pulmonarius]